MKNNTFWGIVGGILLGWVVLLGVLVYPQWDTYGQKKSEVESVKSKLSRFAKQTDDLPTDALKERLQKKVTNLEENNQAARDWFAQRDQRFEDTQGQSNLGNWKTVVFEGGFQALEQRYREHAKLEEKDRLPFQPLRGLNDPDQLTTYQKMWNIMNRVIGAVMDHGGRVEDYDHEAKADDSLAMDLPDFDSMQVTARIELPPSQLTAYVNTLLNDDTINFSISDFAITKNKKHLQYALVTQVDEGAALEEPLVRCLFRFDVQDWNPKAVAAKDDEDEDDEDR